jgi:hypothetical protein
VDISSAIRVGFRPWTSPRIDKLECVLAKI